MITPNDIATKTFKKVAAGYSPEEVDSFLDDIYEDYEVLYLEKTNRPVAPPPVEAPVPVPAPVPVQQVPVVQPQTHIDVEAPDYSRVEKALEKTLMLAEKTALETKENAITEGTQIVKEAKLQAESILQVARAKQYEIEQDISALESRYELMRTRVKLLLYAEIELLDKNEILSKKETKVDSIEG